MKRFLPALPLICCLGLACPVESVKAATIVHTNDVFGELEPCGCRNNPQGGMSRKANLIKQLIERDSSILQVDAGDTLFSSEIVPDLLTEQAELQARYLLRAMDLLKQDVLVPGEKDFALGYATFEKLREKTSVQILAANLKKKNGTKAFESHALFTRNGENQKPIRIAVIGLVGEDLPWPNELKATSAIEEARKLVPELRKKADLVVAVTHQGYEKDVALAKAIKGIDLIIGGHTQSFIQKPVKVGKGTWIYQSSFKNQYVGLIPLQMPFTADGYRLVGLDAGYDSPVDATTAPTVMDNLIKEFKASIAQLNSSREAKMMGQTEPGPSAFHTFPKCAECHTKQFDFWRKTKHAWAFNSLLEKEQSKNKECLSCHTVGLGAKNGVSDVSRLAEVGDAEGTHPLTEKELQSFLKTLHHANSLDEEIKLRESDTKKQPLRSQMNRFERAWTPVQCENCHQPGGEHPFAGGYRKTVEKTLCLGCHTADRAPAWYTKSGQPDFEKIDGKRKEITCPSDSN